MSCAIRKWELSDAADLRRQYPTNGPRTICETDCRTPIPGKMGWRISLRCSPQTKTRGFAFAIVLGSRVIGSIGIVRQENIHRQTAELGYYLAEEYWGQGLMTEAVKKACQAVFEKSDILRIFAEPFVGNAASCRVLEKAGFQYEGTLRSNAVKNGRVVDMKLYALLNMGRINVND